LNEMDAPGVWAWIDNYCQAHPIDNVLKATKAFADAPLADRLRHHARASLSATAIKTVALSGLPADGIRRYVSAPVASSVRRTRRSTRRAHVTPARFARR